MEHGVRLRPFMFFNMWSQHQDFQEIVRNTWDTHIDGSAMFKLCKKLKALKDPLRTLNRQHFSHISARAELAEVELLQGQQLLHDNPGDENLENRVADLRKKASRLAEADLSFCSQLANAKYLKNCDRGTKFFHELIKRNKPRNQIVSLIDAGGAATTSHHQVSALFVDYYKNLLGTRKECTRLDKEILSAGNLVSEDQALELIRPVLDEEIKAALFEIGDDKAPGPDGYSSCFFKRTWNSTGTDVFLAVKEFFTSGCILKQLNNATIVLVPKSLNASRVGHVRPISCCNTVYKIISKILDLRLSTVLEKLIDPAQPAFVPNRSMVENIYMVQELLRKYSWKRISPRCIMKVDPRKAYDTVNWEFLEDALVGLRFPDLFVKWLMQFVTTIAYSISINGSLRGLFKGEQGLRQGDLTRRSVISFSCCHLLGGMDITHLAFADDLILFTRGDVTSVKLSMERLGKFGESSGLSINPAKSNVYMAGIGSEQMEEIKLITGFSVGEFPFRYLGTPVDLARLTIEQFSPLIHKVSEYISAWAGASLSYAGRSELIKSVLQGVECFWLSILPIPVGVRDKIVSLCRNFLWGGKATVKKKPLVSWKEICRPKKEGGLGFIDLSSWNMALLSKALRNIQSKNDSMWVKWVNHVYTKDSPIWEYVPVKQDSQIVRYLCQIRDKMVVEEGSKQAALDKLYQWVVSRQVWTDTKTWMGFTRDLNTIKAAVKWTIKEATGTGVKAIAKRMGIACIVYCIWKHRNEIKGEMGCSEDGVAGWCARVQVWPYGLSKDVLGVATKLVSLVLNRIGMAWEVVLTVTMLLVLLETSWTHTWADELWLWWPSLSAVAVDASAIPVGLL
ncbi:hypothetical protein Acr_21g0002990 [Actinidia rufa]|uniref:Reverse transcriptase domain-containing protein n=1 Tax=Actinidia rufa TaxID=165716 RepID=A0A7J0GFV1_9ERIC|nr:hypothetical protein Acr_21g0002990 [Actinidia rufa]